ncbi:MAG: M6 family metalloprotease domain-containing protein [Prevotella sp.]|nr:M6 family metalloprotease domain-containing protein [Prevotella sp.]
MKRLSTAILMLTIMTISMMAVPAHKKPIQVTQPDGTTVTIKLHGDEWMHFNTTADGYSVVKNLQGYYVYAEKKNGELKATQMVAHDADRRSAAEQSYLAGVKKYQVPEMSEEVAATKKIVDQQQRETLAKRRAASPKAAQYNYSNFKGLIILVQFNDKSFSREDYPMIANNMVNQENFSGFDNQVWTGSVRDYFSDNSKGAFKPQFDVIGPYTVNYSQYDGSNSRKILINALNQADADVDFKDYDGDNDGVVDLVYFILAGNGANYNGNDENLWWPHRSVLFENNNYMYRDGVRLWDYASSVELYGWVDQPSTVKIDGIGTICHEFSHVLGLPDFYDADYEGSGGESNDPGDWSLMAGGSYLNDSRTPIGYSLYERYSVGFADEPETISQPGNYTLEPLFNNQKGYRLNTPEPKEFFLLENRQRSQFKWDAYMPGDGMLVHRVDLSNESVWWENKVNANPDHNYYELLRADGAKKNNGYYAASASDPFPGTKSVHQLTNSSSPANLKTWSGKNNQFGLFDIQQTSDGNITFSVDRYNLAGLTLEEEISVGVGMTKQLTETPIPEYAQYTLTWKSSDDATATVDENGLVRGIKTGTCYITAKSDNNCEATCKVTVVDMPSYNISEFKQLENGEKALLNLENAQVLFTYTKNKQQNTYLRDQSGAILMSKVTMDVKNNDIINGKLYLKNTVNNEVPQFVGIDGETNTSGLAITAGNEAQPRDVAFDELSVADYNDLVIVKGVKIKRENGYWAYSDDNTARIWAGNFGISSGLKNSTQLDGKLFTVTGIYSTNVLNNNIIKELNVTKAVEEYHETGIKQIANSQQSAAKSPTYNMAGQRVDSNYKGLVIKNGKKTINK